MRTRLVRTLVAASICLFLLTSLSTSGAQASLARPPSRDSTAPSSGLEWRWQSQPPARELVRTGSAGSVAALAQGPRVVLIHDDRYIPHHVPAPPQTGLGIQAASLVVRWNPPSCDAEGSVSPWSPDAKMAFSFAVDVWRRLLSSSQTIVIDACWLSDLPAGVLGAAGPLAFYRNIDNEPIANSWYPVSLANVLAGADLNGGEPEIMALFSSTFDWYYGTDGQTPSNKVDFVSVVVHELCHGLGFIGSMNYDDGFYPPECNGMTGVGCWGYGSAYPFIYDRFAEDGNGQPLLLYDNTSSALGDALVGRVGGGAQFNGPYANQANTENGRSPVDLYTPGTWRPGSSYSHLDEIFNGTPNALMTYSLGNGESIHHPGPVTLGMFEDMGWTTSTNTQSVLVYLPSITRNWPPKQYPGVANGDFEDGPTGWTEYSEHGYFLIVDEFPSGVTPHSGAYAAWLGWEHQDTSYVEQQVTVPTAGPYLAYWHWIQSTDVCGSDAGSVTINGSTVDQYDLCASEATSGWVKHVVDLKAYAGQSVELRIKVETNSALRSSLFIDDVSFQSGATTTQQDPVPFDSRTDLSGLAD